MSVRACRRLGARASVLVVAVAASALVVRAPARAGAVGDQFGGYAGAGAGTAIAVIPSIPSFTVVAAPIQANISLASASLSTGGRAFARASTAYPGDLVAGLGPLLEVAGFPIALPAYPIVAESHEYDGDRANEPLPGVSMDANSRAERSTATSITRTADIPAALSFGSARTVSTSTITATSLQSTTTSTVTDVSLAAGAVTIRSIQTVATAVTDGVRGATDGRATVSGLQVGGMAAAVDDQGVHALGQSAPGVDPNAQIAQVLQASGVTMRLLPSSTSPKGPNASRSTGGLMVQLPLPSPGPPVPSGGSVTILLGQTDASVAASPGVAFDLGGLSLAPPAPAEVPPASTTPNLAALVGTSGAAGSPAPVAGGTPALATPTAVSEPVRPVSYRFGGVPLPLALGLLLLVVPGVRAVRRYMFRLYGLGSSPR